jgi:tetratricopeptide (TPR) repeat protein
MKPTWFGITALALALVACQSISDRDTIARLRQERIAIEQEPVQDGLDKAMSGYQHFLEETPDAAQAPEAIRRLADLKIEKEYGTLTGSGEAFECAECADHAQAMQDYGPDPAARPPEPALEPIGGASRLDPEPLAVDNTYGPPPEDAIPGGALEAAHDLENAQARQAIALYTRLLDKYPLYDRNDQVLYQMSRAYEELGQVEQAMQVMDRLVREFAQSRYYDEVQFRRAEYFFAHRHFLDAEQAYTTIVDIGKGSFYYELALYKLGWTFYKQELYEEALHRFIALLDYKVSTGFDFDHIEDDTERKRSEDTFRVISLSFSYLGGADSVVDYFARFGQRAYEDKIYSNLAEFFFDKRRYADAAATYNTFVELNPFHRQAPNFHMRVIEVHAAGGFPSLVLEAKKTYASTYGLTAAYWNHFEPGSRPEVLGYLKTNLTDLANHYHACYQDPRQAADKAASFKEALHWYRQFLTSFPQESESPAINYHLAELLRENRWFDQAAVAYEKTAYGYPAHENAAKAGYAAVIAFRDHLAQVEAQDETQAGAGSTPGDRDAVKQEIVRSSLQFADTFPQHEKAAIVLGAAADDLYVMEEYERALAAAGKLLEVFPETDTGVRRSAWLVIGHASYELLRYSEAEAAYLKVLVLLPAEDPARGELIDNLASSIYKQGEQANAAQDYRLAADHFLRVGRVAPTSKIRPNAEYDAAVALIQLEDWQAAAAVLEGFRDSFEGHALQPEVTKKIAYVYRQDGRLVLAAAEYERIEQESGDDEVRREALQIAAELYTQAGDPLCALAVHQRYVDYFPEPVAVNLETRNTIAGILKDQNRRQAYLEELQRIVAIDAAAGQERTPRTRFLAAQSALVLAEVQYKRFTAVKLHQPFEVNLRQKRDLMKTTVQAFNQLMDYELGAFTAAGTYYLAETYADFSKALMQSERPQGLSTLELEQYELAIEEQAYPFEEKSITVHESNLALIPRGVYNDWIEKSLAKLAVVMPARYDKPEDAGDIIVSLETYMYAVGKPIEPGLADSQAQAPSTADGAGEAGTGRRTPTADTQEPGGPLPVEETGHPAAYEPDQPDPADADELKAAERARRQASVPGDRPDAALQ